MSACPERRLAMLAELAQQTLPDHRAQCRAQQIALDAEVEQSRHGGWRGLRVQGGQHQMPGERGMNRDMRGFRVADFADHDDIGILAHEGAQRGREGETDRRLDLRLVDPGDFVFDGSLDGENLAFFINDTATTEIYTLSLPDALLL